MRRLLATTLLVFAALPARATDVSSSKGKTGGSSSSSSSSSTSLSDTLSESATLNPTTLGNVSAESDYGFMRILSGKPTTQWWHFDVLAEYHHLLVQNDLEGQAPEKNLMYYQLTASADLSAFDRIYVRQGLYEYFLPPQGQPAAQVDDTRFGYQRFIPLPARFYMRTAFYLTAPASIGSQLASLVTEPSLTVLFGRRFGDFSIEVEGVAHYFWSRYSSSAASGQAYSGGNPNEQVSIGGLVDLEYAFPFAPGLVIGVDTSTEYSWSYNISPAANDPSLAPGIITPVQTGFGKSQPAQQSYDDEIYLKYSMPPQKGFGADILVSLANGDPAVGDPSVDQSGVSHVWLFWRQNAEVYTSIALHY
jgi:hypothetical protein